MVVVLVKEDTLTTRLIKINTDLRDRGLEYVTVHKEDNYVVCELKEYLFKPETEYSPTPTTTGNRL